MWVWALFGGSSEEVCVLGQAGGGAAAGEMGGEGWMFAQSGAFLTLLCLRPSISLSSQFPV